jgi:quinol monooxygenase YgiN
VAHRSGFIASLCEMMRVSQAEPGCLHYRFSADLESVGRFYLTEEWASEDALQSHLRTPHFAAFLAQLDRCEAKRSTDARCGELAPYQLRRAEQSK